MALGKVHRDGEDDCRLVQVRFSAMAFFDLREQYFVVMELGSHFIRADINVQDVNRIPSVLDYPACVARKEDDKDASSIVYVGKEALESSHLTWPLSTDRDTPDWIGVAALLKQIIQALGVERARNESPVLFLIPAVWPHGWREHLVQIAFENLNAPGVAIMDQPLATLYGLGATSGVVIDVGHETSDVSVIVDCIVQRHACVSIPIGGRDLDTWIWQLAQHDNEFKSQLGEREFTTEMARQIKESGKCVVSESSLQSHPTDRIAVTLEEGHALTIGGWRNQVADPLFVPSILEHHPTTPGIIDTIISMVSRVNQDQQRLAWSKVILTGQISRLPGLAARFESELHDQLPVTEYAAEAQPPMEVKVVCHAPEYLTEVADHGELLAMVGGKITSKVVFADVKNYISKADYNERGPMAARIKGL